MIDQNTEAIEHNQAGLGDLSVTAYSLNGIDLFDVKDCMGVKGAYYPQHIVTMFKRPFFMEGDWEGSRIKSDWKNGTVLFIPEGSVLNFDTATPYDETVIRLRHELFVRAAKEHIDLGKIDFSFLDVTSMATWTCGAALGGIVMDESYRNWPMLVEATSISLALAVMRELAPHGAREFKPVRYGLNEARRRRVLSYINDNLNRQISLAELAGVANLSIYHFTRKFKNVMGMSPLQFVSIRRVEAAKRLLRTTSESLAEISIICGFASQSHFTTVFKKVTGTTPAAYRSALN